MDSESFSEKIQVTKQLLESRDVILYEQCLEFTKGSIGFLKTVSGSAGQKKTDDVVLTEWYPVFMKILHVLYKLRKERDVNLEIVLSHINHVLIHLIHVKEVPVDWFHSLGLINLEFLHCYHLSPSHKQDFLSSLVQKSHQCMRVLAQGGGGSNKGCNKSPHQFKLLVISFCYTALDGSITEDPKRQQQQQESLTSCKGCVSNFLQLWGRPGSDNSGFLNEASADVAKELFQLCCIFYCLWNSGTPPTGPLTDKDACFFKELFRLVQHFSPYRHKLVHCGGDFTSILTDLGVVCGGFPLEEILSHVVTNASHLQAGLSGNKDFEFTVSICRVVHILMLKSEGQTPKDCDSELSKELESSINHLQSIFSDHSSAATRLPQCAGEIVSILSNSVINESFKKFSSVAIDSKLHDLFSLSLDVLIRDVLCYSGSPSSELSASVASLAARRSYDMAVVSKSRMMLLQSLLLQNDLDDCVQIGVSARLKSSLNLLCLLVKKVKKGSGLSAESSAYRTIFKTLKNAVCSLGSLCRLLRRLEKYDTIIAVASPLWPVANLPEMLSVVSHQESLCEAYRVQGNVEAACQIVVQASALGSHLVTPGLLKVIVKIARMESSLKIPVLFSRCTEESGVFIMLSLVRLMAVTSSTSQTFIKHQKTVLRHLVDSTLSSSDMVLVKLMLAEFSWYCPDTDTTSLSSKNNDSVISDYPLELLQDCVTESDLNCQDFKAQAVLLTAEIHHTLACLKLNHTSCDNKPSNASTGRNDNDNKNNNSGDNNSNNNNNSLLAINTLEASELSSSVFDTPVTHSVHRSKIAKQRKGVTRQKLTTMADKNIESSSSLIFPIWEDSNMAGSVKSGNSNSDDGVDDANLDDGDDDDDKSAVGISELDSKELLSAAWKSFCLWKDWYEEVGGGNGLTSGGVSKTSSTVVKEMDDGTAETTAAATSESLAFRMDRNLSFLQHLVSLALTLDKPMLAFECLCYAKELATQMKKSVATDHVNCAFLSLLGQVELDGPKTRGADGGSRSLPSHSTDGSGLQVKNLEELLLKVEKGEQGESSHLVSMASYLFYTHKVRESVRFQKRALAQIESIREKEPLTPTLTLQLTELKCLMMENNRLVELQDIYQEEAMTGQHPLQVLGEALKYITSLKNYLTGKSEHVLVRTGASVDSWQMIHCYLNTLYLGGKIFLQAGMVKSSRTYLLEGLKMAQSCQLATWSALFITSLANICINYTDSVPEADKYLKSVSKMVSLTTMPGWDSWTVDDLGQDNDLSTIDSALTSLSIATSNACPDSSSNSLDKKGNKSKNQPATTTTSVDFSPKLSAFLVYRMWLEAEIALQQNPPNIPKAVRHLLNAKRFASSILNTRLQLSNIQNIKQSAGHYELLIVETMLRLAQAFFYLLVEKSKQRGLCPSWCLDDRDDVSSSTCSRDPVWEEQDVEKLKQAVLNLLEAVVNQGKQLLYSYEAKVVVATAQLLKIHTSLLSSSLINQKSICEDGDHVFYKGEDILKHENGDKDKMDAWMDCDDNDDDEYEALWIAKEVKELKIEEEFWNEKYKQRLGVPPTAAISSSSSSSLFTQTPHKIPFQDKTNKRINVKLSSSSSSTAPQNTPDIQSQSSLSSPTKRFSPLGECQENVISPSPPKLSKGNSNGNDVENVSTVKTPASFFSPAAKIKKGDRRGGKSNTALRTATIKALQFGDGNDMQFEVEKENESTVTLSPNQSASDNNVRKVSHKMESKGTRGGRKKRNLGNAASVKGEEEEKCDDNDIVSHEQMDHDSNCSELSPVINQMGRLNICKKSVSPVKRKSNESLSRTMLEPGVKEGSANEEEVTESGSFGMNKGKSGVGRKARGAGKKTSSKSAILPKESQTVNKENILDSLDSCQLANEIKENSPHAEMSNSPKVKVSRRAKRTASSKPKSSDVNDGGCGKSTRRTTRRHQKVKEQPQANDEHQEDDSCSPEVQRGESLNRADMFSLSTEFNVFPSSPVLISDNDFRSVDNVSGTQNIQFFDSPIQIRSTSSVDENAEIDYKFDIFSTPLRNFHLNSPIEIPRGKPQLKNPTVEKQLKSSQIDKKGKKERHPVGNFSSVELPSGLGDEEESNETNAVNSRVSRKCLDNTSQRSKAKLSLKKKSLRDSDLDKSGNKSLQNGFDGGNENDKVDTNEIALKSEFDNEVFSISKVNLKGRADVKNSTKGRSEKVQVKRDKISEPLDSRMFGKNSVMSSVVMRKDGYPASLSSPLEKEELQRNSSVLQRNTNVIDKKLLSDAVESLSQLRAFPPSYTFNNLSKAVAVGFMMKQRADDEASNDDVRIDPQTSVAGHLANSMHVTFQHMLNKNMISKLRAKKSNDKHHGTDAVAADEDEDDLDRELPVMREVLDNSLLQQPAEQSLMDKLTNIPKDWVVVQMAVVSLAPLQQHSAPCQVLITRLSSDKPPMTFRMSLDRWKDFSRAKRVLEPAIIHHVEGMTPEKYWTYRYKNDQDVKNVLYFLQEKFLSGHKWLLTGRLTKVVGEKYVSTKLHLAAVELVKELKKEAGERMDTACCEVILEVLMLANEKDAVCLLNSVWPCKKHICDRVLRAIFKLQKEVWPVLDSIGAQGKDGKNKKQEEEEEEEGMMERGPVILILDKQFSQIPWESMPFLKSDRISRVPSLAALQALLCLHRHRTDSVFQSGISRRNVMTVIDPETNLENSVKLLQPQYEKYKGWKCQTQQTLTVSALREYLSQDLYIYSGHGWGRQFVAGDELQMFHAKAVAIIMGCNSGRLEYGGRMSDNQGPPLYFLLAGCPAVVGNLWVVTDKDIDKLTSRLCHAWMTSKGQRSLGRLVNEARQACKLVGLNGFAPVIYGLPIHMS